MTQIRGHLASLARTACAAALAALRLRAEALEARPEALPDFAAYQVPALPAEMLPVHLSESCDTGCSDGGAFPCILISLVKLGHMGS